MKATDGDLRRLHLREGTTYNATEPEEQRPERGRRPDTTVGSPTTKLDTTIERNRPREVDDCREEQGSGHRGHETGHESSN
jgi:hypothetical protein